jgi:hypothetical protein
MTRAALILTLVLLAGPAWTQQTSGLPFCSGDDCLNWMDDTHCSGTGHSCDEWIKKHDTAPHPAVDYILVLKCHAGVCQSYAPCGHNGRTWFPDASGQCNAKDERR